MLADYLPSLSSHHMRISFGAPVHAFRALVLPMGGAIKRIASGRCGITYLVSRSIVGASQIRFPPQLHANTAQAAMQSTQ